MRADPPDNFSNTSLNFSLTHGPTFAKFFKQAFYASCFTMLLLYSTILQLFICFEWCTQCYMPCRDSDQNRFYRSIHPFLRNDLYYSTFKFLFQSTVFLLNHEWFSHTRSQALTRAGIFNFINLKHKIISKNQQFQSLTLSLSHTVFSLPLSLSLSLPFSFFVSIVLPLFLSPFPSLSLTLF